MFVFWLEYGDGEVLGTVGRASGFQGKDLGSHLGTSKGDTEDVKYMYRSGNK